MTSEVNPELEKELLEEVSTDQVGFLRPPEWEEQTLLGADALRVLRIQDEFVRGFTALADVGPAVTLFGSARLPQEHPDAVAAYQVAKRLGAEGLSIISGGGPGIMEAANRGAKEAGALSIAANIRLPHETTPNPYQDISLTFHYFFVRKVMLVKYAQAFVIFPGGFGTLDELFEVLTLIQTEKVPRMPIVLYRSSYWEGMIRWIKEQLLGSGCISREDLSLFRVADTVDEAVEAVIEPLRKAGILRSGSAAG